MIPENLRLDGYRLIKPVMRTSWHTASSTRAMRDTINQAIDDARKNAGTPLKFVVDLGAIDSLPKPVYRAIKQALTRIKHMHGDIMVSDNRTKQRARGLGFATMFGETRLEYEGEG